MMASINFGDRLRLLDVVGHAVTRDGLTFVHAVLWTADDWEGSGVPLTDYSTAYLPLGFQPGEFNLLESTNAIWVRARLPMVFGFAPPTSKRATRRQFLDVGFIAYLPDQEPRFIPFVCTDIELNAELRFNRSLDRNIRDRIAEAFWYLLVDAPENLATFRDRLWTFDGHGYSSMMYGYWKGRFHESCGRMEWA